MSSGDPYTVFPAYAVFIGANMGIAAYIHFGKLIGLTYALLRHLMISSMLLAALLAIIGSKPLFDHPDFGIASIRVLCFSYAIMVIIFVCSSKLIPDERAAQVTLDDHRLDS
jgi:hypothetical protein